MGNPVGKRFLELSLTAAIAAIFNCLLVTALLAQSSDNDSRGRSTGNTGGSDVLSLRVVAGKDWAPVSFDLVRGVILFQASINGRQATVLLDNGTEKSAVDDHFAQKIGLELSKGPGFALTVAGTIPFSRTSSAVFEVPGAFRMTGRLVAFDMRSISKAVGREVNAILGGDAFNMLAVMVRPSTRQLGMISSGTIKFNGPDVVEIPLAARGIVEVIVNDTPVKLAVDLGSSGFVRLSDTVWQRIFSDSRHPGFGSVHATADGATTWSRAMYGDVSIGSASVKSVAISSGYVPIKPVDGLLGNGILLKGDVLVDMPSGKLALIIPRNKSQGH